MVLRRLIAQGRRANPFEAVFAVEHIIGEHEKMGAGFGQHIETLAASSAHHIDTLGGGHMHNEQPPAHLAHHADATLDGFVLHLRRFALAVIVRRGEAGFNEAGNEYLYIRTFRSGKYNIAHEMLFNLTIDPHEQNDIAETEKDLIAKAGALLDSWEKEMPGPNGDPKDTVLSEKEFK